MGGIGILSTHKRTLLSLGGVAAFVGTALICYGALADKLAIAFAAVLIPILAIIIVRSFDSPKVAFMLLFVVNYFIPITNHYIIDFPTGLFMDVMICFNFFVIICSALTKKINLDNVSFDILLAINIWLIYCILEIFNARMLKTDSWISSIRNMAIYFVCVFLIVQICVRSFDDLKEILAVWSVLVVIAAGKAAWQKYVGFSKGDYYFLNYMGGRVTHFIYYGIRYFSIFSDASNFGGSMGLGVVVFSIKGLHTKKLSHKLWWWFVGAAATYGMFISGTRSALVVPAAGIMLYLVLIRDFKKAIPAALVLGTVVFILAFTTIGGSNAYIRRARTIFHKDEDLSYLIRKENQAKLREIMKTMPFGNSLGMSGGRSQEYGELDELSTIPTDSWFVQIWVETGVVGMIIYFGMIAFLFIRAGIFIFFKLKDPEIKGVSAALLSGIAGLLVESTNAEVFSQYPNGIIVYTCFALVFLCPIFDKKRELENAIPDEQ